MFCQGGFENFFDLSYLGKFIYMVLVCRQKKIRFDLSKRILSNGYLAGVAAPASLGFPLSCHRRVAATKFTTSNNLLLSYSYYIIFIRFDKSCHFHYSWISADTWLHTMRVNAVRPYGLFSQVLLPQNRSARC